MTDQVVTKSVLSTQYPVPSTQSEMVFPMCAFRSRILCYGLLGALSITLPNLPTAAAKPANFMMRARVDGKMLEGQPLYWTNSQMLLLGRDGQLHEFHPKKAKESRKTSPQFFGYNMREMKQQLYDQFGKTADITTTQHYIVVHPRGQKSEWAQRFEDLYRSFHRYFRVRGFSPKEPPYPLVAVVFRNQRDYYAYASKDGTPLAPGTLGHYSPQSNRVFLFDARQAGSGDWTTNAETIIHEATHQTAFNTGIHERFADAPRWLVEGLATMYEARGVYDYRSSDSRNARLNVGRLRDFQHFVKTRRKEGFMADLIASDVAFRRDATGAYAEAWALTFFLAETRPSEYAQYLARTANREAFTDYPRSERLADFQDVFHKDLKWLEAQLLRFIEDL